MREEFANGEKGGRIIRSLEKNTEINEVASKRLFRETNGTATGT